MYGLMTFLIFFLVFIVLFASIPVGISAIAYYSRKSKRNKIKQNMPSGVSYIANVRMNTPKKNDAVMKMKAFEFSGVLYLKDGKIIIEGTKGQHSEFDLKTAEIAWPGVQIQNGLIQWFWLVDPATGEKLYINGETGLFVFRLSKKLPSTRDIFDYLVQQQQIARIGATQREE